MFCWHIQRFRSEITKVINRCGRCREFCLYETALIQTKMHTCYIMCPFSLPVHAVSSES